MSTTHAVVMADTEGRIRHWDAGAQRLFGYTPDEALGQSLDLIVPPPFRDRHWAGFRKAIATGICNLDRATTNIPVRCKDGTVQAFPGRFVFLQSARGEVVGSSVSTPSVPVRKRPSVRSFPCDVDRFRD